MSDVNSNVVGPSSLTVSPTVYFVQGPQRLWALGSQLHDSHTGLPGQALPVLGSGSVLGIPLELEDRPTVHHDVLRTKRRTP